MAEYFSEALYLRNLKRFWPLAVIVFVVAFFSFVLSEITARPFRAMMDPGFEIDIIMPLARYSVSFVPIFSIITAIAMFGYLHRPKSAGFISSLPISRRGIYITNLLSGLTILLVPTIIIGIMHALLFIGQPVPLDHILMWFHAIIFAHLFFYSLAVFTTFLTGKPVMQAFLFAFLQGVAALFIGIGYGIADMMVFGYTAPFDPPMAIAILTPPYAIWAIITSLSSMGEIIATSSTYVIVMWVMYPVLTVALLFFGYRLYKHRKIESAGTVIAHKAMRSTFKYIIGILMGAMLGFATTGIINLGDRLSMSEFVITLTVSAIIFGALGCLFTEMLIKKRFRVWKTAGKSILFLTAGIVVVILFVRLDATGYERRTPNPNNVVAVSVSTQRFTENNVLFRDIVGEVVNAEDGFATGGREWSIRTGDCCIKCFGRLGGTIIWTEEMIDEIKLRTFDFFETPEAIAAAIELHRTIIENRRDLEDYALQWHLYRGGQIYYFTYRMSDGRIITRQYVIPDEAMEALGIVEPLLALYSQPEAVEKRNRFMALPDTAILLATATIESDFRNVAGIGARVHVDPIAISGEALASVMEAMRKDAEEGTLGHIDIFGNLNVYYNQSTVLAENPVAIRLNIIYDFVATNIPEEFSTQRLRCPDAEESIEGLLQTIIITHYNTHTMQVLRELGIIS